MPTISIIIPVYGVEAFISRCIESVLVQTFTDWELLLVDDGSPDRSGEICDAYAIQDRRIRVFHTPNGGTSRARNRGLDEAKGDWILFADSDDWLDETCLEHCYQVVMTDQLDLVQHGRMLVNEQGKQVIEYAYATEVMDGDAYVSAILHNCEVWGALISRSFIDSLHLRFQPGLKNGQDVVFILSLLRYAKRIKHISDVLYYYYIDNPGSATHQITSNRMLDLARALVPLGQSWPVAKPWVDLKVGEILLLLILNRDVPEPVVSDLARQAQIVSYRRFPCKLYVKIARYSPWLAFQVTRVGFLLKHGLCSFR